jgi:predicted phosphate transport protein (TIGR00153 family)
MLTGKLEREAFRILKGNAKAVHDVVKKFEEFINAYFSEENLEKAESLGREVASLETRADKGRRDFLALLSRGAFLPAFRGDLAWLAERLDRVADTTEGAMRAVLLRKQLVQALKRAEKRNRRVKEWRNRFLKIARLTTQTVEILREAVEALEKDIDTALRKAKDVDSLEHEVDLIEQETVSDLYELEKLFDPITVVQLADILRRMGNITDRAEDMSDSIAILAMTLTM